MFAKVGSKFYQVVNKAFKSCPNTFKFCQSGEISPSLFTLSSFTYFEKGEILSLKVFGSFQKNLRKYPPHFFVVNRSQIFLQLDHIELLMHYTHCPDSNHQSLARTARHKVTMDQRAFVFATRGQCIKGKQCQRISIKIKYLFVFKTS